MFAKPLFWIVFAAVSIACGVFAISFFPRVFTIVSVDITMTRDVALRSATELAERQGWGPRTEPRTVASFAVNQQVQTFVELEAGGAEAFARIVGGDIYTPYTWRVRLFEEGETNETIVHFRPNGRPFGFTEKIADDTERPSLAAPAARQLGEAAALADWHIDLSTFERVESGQESMTNDRVDHRFVYERASELLGEGRLQVHVDVSGDRVSRVMPAVRVPESFQRRYEEMRSANTGIGMGGSAGAILYLLIGCGAGSFYLLRRQTLIWRPALALAAIIAVTQILDGLNGLPLSWIGYNTSLSATSFLIQSLLQLVVMSLALGGVMAVTFVAAEGLSRMAFPNHPQLWRIWSRPAAPTAEIFGQTAIGYLLVPVVLAILVAFYYVAGQQWGWWNPSDTLVSPNTLAHYAPWFSPFALSLQAGVWEECLFRAVPLAGAALLGQRYGHRSLFIGIAFVLQAVIFGAAHATYPAQPAYARLVELIVPSTIFGLLYLRFGLLPAIVLHFLYDIVLMAMPVFATEGSGVLLDRMLVVLLALSPALVIAARYAQTREFGLFPDALRNAGWQAPFKPPPPTEEVQEGPDRREWPNWLIPVLAITCALTLPAALWLNAQDRLSIPRLELSSNEALQVARETLAQRSVELPPETEELVSVLGSISIQDIFLWQTAGREIYEPMVGGWIHPPRYLVRFARFEGDVAARAEEWVVTVTGDGSPRTVRHQLAEDAPGASLTEEDARAIALAAIEDELHIDRASVKEVSVEPEAQPVRNDWVFIYEDTAHDRLPEGERRIRVDIAGDEATGVVQFIHIPEEWTRERQSEIAMNIVSMLQTLAQVGIMIVGAIAGIIAWSRGTFLVRYGLLSALAVLLLSAGNLINNLPIAIANFSTAQPFGMQIATMLIAGVISLFVIAAGIGLNSGMVARWRRARADVSQGKLILAGILIGMATVGSSVSVQPLTSAIPLWPSALPAASTLPMLAPVLQGGTGFIRVCVTFLLVFGFVDRMTLGWSLWRGPAVLLLFAIGALTLGSVREGALDIWAVSATVSGLVFALTYVLLIRHDLALVPIVVATIGIVGLASAMSEPYPGALAGSAMAAILIAVLGWASFSALRRVE